MRWHGKLHVLLKKKKLFRTVDVLLKVFYRGLTKKYDLSAHTHDTATYAPAVLNDARIQRKGNINQMCSVLISFIGCWVIHFIFDVP